MDERYWKCPKFKGMKRGVLSLPVPLAPTSTTEMKKITNY
jgi:hypothetical protein